MVKWEKLLQKKKQKRYLKKGKNGIKSIFHLDFVTQVNQKMEKIITSMAICWCGNRFCFFLKIIKKI